MARRAHSATRLPNARRVVHACAPAPDQHELEQEKVGDDGGEATKLAHGSRR